MSLTHFASRARATIPAARGAAAEVPEKEFVHVSFKSAETYSKTQNLFILTMFSWQFRLIGGNINYTWLHNSVILTLFWAIDSLFPLDNRDLLTSKF